MRHLQLKSSLQLFDIILNLKSSIFVVHFLDAIRHGNKEFSKGSSQNEIVHLLLIFYLQYGKYKGMKICFYSCRYQNQSFSVRLHLCRSCSTRVSLVHFVQHLCRTCVALLLLLSHACCSCGTHVIFVFLVLHSCCLCLALVL